MVHSVKLEYNSHLVDKLYLFNVASATIKINYFTDWCNNYCASSVTVAAVYCRLLAMQMKVVLEKEMPVYITVCMLSYCNLIHTESTTQPTDSTSITTEIVAIIVGGVLIAILIISIAVTVSVIVIVMSRCRNVSSNE